MNLQVYLLVLPLFLPLVTFGQSGPVEYFITGNANLYLPSNSQDKSMYPILWYDSDSDPKLLVGGFGLGVSGWKHLKGRINLKMNTGLARNVYWDEPYFMTENGIDAAGPFQVRSSDFTLGLSGVLHYQLKGKLFAGAGLGARILLHSVARLPDLDVTLANRHYKTVMPVMLVELALKSKKFLFSICYEYGSLNRLKGDLAGYRKDNYGLLVFEMGVRVR